MTIKSTINNIWRPEYKKALHDLIDTTHKLVTHTYLFIKFIFIEALEEDDAFDLNSYVNKNFFVEVFLALTDRKERSGTLKEETARYRDLISQHKAAYFATAKYNPPKVVNAQQIALFECTKIQTAYYNNLTAHFGNRLRMFLNFACNLKKESDRITKKMKEERYDEAAIKQIIKKTVIEPCNAVKLKFSQKEIPTDAILTTKRKDELKEILSAYPTDYMFKQSSIFYDIKASPDQHFNAFFQLTKLCQSNDLKSFHCFPLRHAFVPSYMTIDTKIVNYHILKRKGMTEDKVTIWNHVVYKHKKPLKQKEGNPMVFQGTIETDGIGVSVIKQNFENSSTRPGQKNKRVTAITKKPKDADQDDKVKHINDLNKDELKSLGQQCVLIDPNRRDLMYCMNENSTVEKKQVFRFTSCCRSKRSRHFRILRKKTKPVQIKHAETALSKTRSFSVVLADFNNYIKTRAVYEDLLYVYYGNETRPLEEDLYPLLNNDFNFRKRRKKTTGYLFWGNFFVANYRGVFPENIHSDDTEIQTFIQNLHIMLQQATVKDRICQETRSHLDSVASEILRWCEEEKPDREAIKSKYDDLKTLLNISFKPLQYLPFRKMRFSSKTYYDQVDDKLIRNLRSKFGDGAVLIIGDWSVPSTKFQEPQRNKGLIRLLKKNGFQVYMVNEHKTSSVCPECEGELVTFKKVPNPRPHKRKERPTVTCHGLLKCVQHSPPLIYNRDMAAVLNFRKILQQLRQNGTRPSALSRKSSPGSKRKRDEDTAQDGNQKKNKKHST